MATYELTLVPAYGRDYQTKEDCLRDWLAGKDFQIATVVSPDCGRYCEEVLLIRLSDGQVTSSEDDYEEGD